MVRVTLPQAAAALVASVFLARLLTLGASSFGAAHGFNEAVYSNIASSYGNPFRPLLYGIPFHDTPPLTTWLMAGTFTLLGESEFSARLPSVFAIPVLAAVSWAVAARFSPRAGPWAAMLTLTPWMILWAGRAQTDAHVAALTMVAIAGYAWIDRRAGPILVIAGLALGVMAKQTALIAVLVGLLFVMWKPEHRARSVAATATGLALGLAWYIVAWWLEPAQFTASLAFHVGERSTPFVNAPLTIFMGLIVGMLATLALAAWMAPRAWRGREAVPFAMVALAGALVVYTLWDAPFGHQYYTVQATGPLAVLASTAIARAPQALLAGAVALNVAMAAPVLYIHGDLSDDAMQRLAAATDGPVDAPSDLVPQLRHYGADAGDHPDAELRITREKPPCPVIMVVKAPPQTNYLSRCEVA